MPKFDVAGTGTFTFSGVRPDELDACEYTLVSILCDISSSVRGFAPQLLKTVQKIIEACQHSDRSENLMLRFVTFNSNLDEIHGFKELHDIKASDYADLQPSGCTALFDAVYSGVGAVLTYAETLQDQEFNVNGAVFVITDGDDNDSSMTPADIKKLTDDALRGEKIESLITVLVGLKDPSISGQSWSDNTSAYLDNFQTEAGLTQYLDVGSATMEQLAKLAQFVSQSISSQSNALGSGSASQPMSLQRLVI